jgi:hypothetical protein
LSADGACPDHAQVGPVDDFPGPVLVGAVVEQSNQRLEQQLFTRRQPLDAEAQQGALALDGGVRGGCHA